MLELQYKEQVEVTEVKMLGNEAFPSGVISICQVGSSFKSLNEKDQWGWNRECYKEEWHRMRGDVRQRSD